MSTDPSIRLWKTSPTDYPQDPNWAYWKSPDVFVDNNGNRMKQQVAGFEYYNNVDSVGEPEKGLDNNRLFAVIRNLGNAAAQGVQVNFSFTVYGMVGGQQYSGLQFKSIATVPVDLGPAGSVDGEKEVEVQWDLSDLTDDNGGLWPAPIAAFNHFCIQVSLAFQGDSNPNNNWTQHNESNVISLSPFRPVPMVVANSEPEAKTYELVPVGLPEKWRLQVRVLETRREEKGDVKREDLSKEHSIKLALGPGEAKLVLVTIIGPKGEERKSLAAQAIGISLIADGKAVNGVSLKPMYGASVPSSAKRPRCSPPVLLTNQRALRFPMKETVVTFRGQVVSSLFEKGISLETLREGV